MLRTLTFLLALLSATPALAAADLRVTIPAPAAQYVGNTVSYSIVVANIGNKNVSSSSLIVQLPTTNTSPTVYVMGTLSAVDSRCTPSGTRLICTLGAINRNASKTVTFGIALPEAAQTLSVTGTASTPSSENTLTNNVATNTPNLLNYAFSIVNGAAAVNRHCTGTALTSFFECELFPSSISAHDTVFWSNGTLTFPATTDYTGTWSQPTAQSLVFAYYEFGTLVAEFEGYGVGGDCFEGVTTFPNSSWVSPYEVCL